MSRLNNLLAIVAAILFAIAALSLPLGKLAVICAGVIGLLAVMAQPRLGFYLFAFCAVCLPYSTVTLGIRITVSEALLLLIWIAIAWDSLSPKLHWTLTPTHKAAFVLALFTIVPFIWGQLFIVAPGSGVVSWGRWLLNLSTLLLVTLLIENQKQLYTLLLCLLGGAVAMVLVSMSYFVRHFDARDFGDFLELVRYGNPDAYIDIFSSFNQRMGSPWVHPNLLGGVLALLLPVTYGWWLSTRGTRFNPLLLLSTGIILVGMLLSVSRGAILSIAIILIWLAAQGTPYAKSMLIMGAMVGIAAALFYPPIQQRLFSSSVGALSASDSLRITEYKEFPRAVAAYPLGIGFKTDPPVPGSGMQGISNLWLNYIYKIGIVGMFLFVRVLRSWWREVRTPMREGSTSPIFYLHQGVVAGVCAALLTGLVDHYFSFTNVLVAILWMLVGVSLLTAKFAAEKQVDSEPVNQQRIHDERALIGA